MIPTIKPFTNISELKSGDSGFVFSILIMSDVNGNCYIDRGATVFPKGGYESSNIKIIKTDDGFIGDTTFYLEDEVYFFMKLLKNTQELPEEDKKYQIVKWITTGKQF